MMLLFQTPRSPTQAPCVHQHKQRSTRLRQKRRETIMNALTFVDLPEDTVYQTWRFLKLNVADNETKQKVQEKVIKDGKRHVGR